MGLTNLGGYSARVFFFYNSIISILTLGLILMINIYGENPLKFPHIWIRNAVNHYPEYIFYRVPTIAGSLFLIFGWIANHFHLYIIGKKKCISINKYKPYSILIMGIAGSLFLMGSAVNIDLGKQQSSWHKFCQLKYFMLTMLAQTYNTVISCHMYFVHNTGSKIQTYSKLLYLFLLLVQVIISLDNSFFTVFEEINNFYPDIHRLMALEWTFTFSICIGNLLMAYDVSKFNFRYVYRPKDPRSANALQRSQLIQPDSQIIP